MKNLLWYQNPSNSGDDLLFVNGESITPPSNPIYSESFSFLLKAIKDKIYLDVDRATVYKSSKGHTLKGNLEDKDVIGRFIPFIFYSEAQTVKEFIDDFKIVTNKLDLKFSDEKYNNIEMLAARKKRSRGLFHIGLIIAFAMLLFLITKNCVS